MTLRAYLPVRASEVPVSKVLTINNQKYTWVFFYNARHDFYTIQVKNDAGEIVYTSRVVLDDDILHAIVTLGFTSKLRPKDPTGEATQVDSSNFGDAVKIWVLNY